MGGPLQTESNASGPKRNQKSNIILEGSMYPNFMNPLE